MSLKELYKNGIIYLYFGGRIVHTNDGNNDYYDLYKDDEIDETGEPLLCDGEKVDFEKKYNISTGLPYWYGITERGKAIYLTNDEYRISVFQ